MSSELEEISANGTLTPDEISTGKAVAGDNEKMAGDNEKVAVGRSLSTTSENGLSLSFDAGTLNALQSAFEANINEGELQFSRLAIAQPLTPEVANKEPGWQGGCLFDNITKEIYTVKDYPPWMLEKGASKDDLSKIHFCMFVFITKLPTEYVLWKDRKTEGQGMHWKTLDREDPRVIEGVWPRDGGTWGTKEEEKDKKSGKSLPPPVTVNHNFLGMAIDHSEGLIKSSPLVVSFNRTSAQTGSKLANFLSRHRMQGIPIFGRTYWLFTKSVPHAETNGVYYIYQAASGKLTKDVNPEIMKFCLESAVRLSDKKNGREYQEMILNAAQLEHEESDEQLVQSDGTDINSEPDF